MKNNVIQKKNGIVVVGAIFVDIKGFPQDIYVPDGTSAGLTYGKSMLEAMKIGSHLASSVIASCENVCPCFSQDKFDIVKK